MSERDRSMRQGKPYLAQTAMLTSLHFAGHETQSQMWNHAPDALALEYTQTMMGFVLFHDRVHRIGMVGLGGGSLVKFCYRYLPDARIEVVEINPQVLALRESFQIPPDDARLHVLLADGADTVAQTRHTLDVLLVDGYDRDGIPPRLCSPEFYLHCRRALRKPGLMVANIVAAHPQHDVLIERIRCVFDGVLVVHDDDGSNDVVFAWIGELDEQYLADYGRPQHIRAEASDHLIPAMSRVRLAWRERG